MRKNEPPPFADPAAVESYEADTPRRVPGLADLHRMVTLLLAEGASAAAHMLVVGAGGGLELKAMAEARPDWCFAGIDPSPAMLNLARRVALPFMDRVDLISGTVDQAPPGPFDGASCLLVLHFLDRSERLQTLQEIRCRLKPQARLVVVHHAPPGDDPERWLARSAAFADRGGLDPARAAASARTMTERLPMLAPDEEVDMLREAGFRDVALFYAAFSFRGWVATAGPP